MSRINDPYNIFGEAASQQGTMFPGAQPIAGPSVPFLPGSGGGVPQGAFQSAVQAVLPMVSEYFRQQFGGFAFTFNGDRSALDAARSREFLFGLQEARQTGAREDSNRLFETLTGLNRALGGDPGPAQMEAFRRIADRGGQMLPILAAAFPEMVDTAAGSIGSRTVAAQNFFMANRFTAGIDNGQFMNAALDRLYGTGRPGDPFTTERTFGLGMGRMAGAFDELSRRGVVGENVRRPDGSIDSSASGQRAADQLKQYAGALAVVRDIFGDMGQPNAPMQQIVQALDAITRGGVGNMDPARLTQLAGQFRTVVAGGRGGLAPVDYGQLIRFGQMAGQFGQEFGLMPRLSEEGFLTGVRSGAAFDELFKGQVSPELFDKNRFVQERMRLQAAGLASDYMNRVGAVIGVSRHAAPGSDFAKLSQALSRGETTVELDGRRVDIRSVQDFDLEAIAQRSGLAPGAFQERLQFRESNQAALAANPLAQRLAQPGQRAELERALTTTLLARVADPEATAKEISRLSQTRDFRNADELAQAVAQSLGRPKEAAAIAGGILQAGNLTGDSLAVMNRLRIVGEKTEGAEAEMQRRIEDENAKQMKLIGLERGTMGQKLMDWLSGLGRPAADDAAGALGGGGVIGAGQVRSTSFQDMLLKMFGLVSNERAAAALNVPESQLPGQAGGMQKVEITNKELIVKITGTADDVVRAVGTARFTGR